MVKFNKALSCYGRTLHSERFLCLSASLSVFLSTKGSIPEEDAGRLYNTCAVFGPDGALLVRHRKVGRGCAGLTAS